MTGLWSNGYPLAPTFPVCPMEMSPVMIKPGTGLAELVTESVNRLDACPATGKVEVRDDEVGYCAIQQRFHLRAR